MIQYHNLYAKVEDDFIRLSLDEHGKARKFFILKTPQSNRFAGFTMMTRDIDLVIEAINELLNSNQSVIIQQSLMFFAIVTYSKCFTSNNGYRPSLDSNDIFKTDEFDLKDEHNRIMDLRNGYVAHAGLKFDQFIVTGTMVESGNTIVGVDVNCQLLHAVNMQPKLPDFLRLCEFIKGKIKLKSDKALGKLMEYVTNLEYKDISKLLSESRYEEIFKMIEVDKTSSSEFKQIEFIKHN